MQFSLPRRPIGYVALVLAVLAFVTIFFDAVAYSGKGNKANKESAEEFLEEYNSNESMRQRYDEYSPSTVATFKAMKSGGISMLEMRGIIGADIDTAKKNDREDEIEGEDRAIYVFVLLFLILTIIALVLAIAGSLLGIKYAYIPLCVMMLVWMIMAFYIASRATGEIYKAADNVGEALQYLEKNNSSASVLNLTLWPFIGFALSVAAVICGKKGMEA